MNVGCVVMAAGKSTRFGKNKLLAPLAGKPLLAHTLHALPRERLARIVAVTSDDAVSSLCEMCGIRSVQYSGGPQSETVRRGIEEMEGLDGCLFVQGDQPLCSACSMERLLDAFDQNPEAVHRLSFDSVPGSPVIFPGHLFSALRTLSGECGGMTAARRTGAAIHLVPAYAAFELLDADTENALAQIERIYLEEAHTPNAAWTP